MNLQDRRHISALIGLLISFTACTATHRTRILTAVFDGVPSEKTPQADALVVAESNASDEVSLQVSELYARARAAPPGVRHKPFANRECLSCHESQFSEKLRADVTELCQLCHKSMFGPRSFPHAPVEAKHCLECHKPHESIEPALLAQSEREVCAKCHDQNRVLSTPAHTQIGNDACHGCHDSHGGQKKYFLKETVTVRAVAPTASS